MSQGEEQRGRKMSVKELLLSNSPFAHFSHKEVHTNAYFLPQGKKMSDFFASIVCLSNSKELWVHFLCSLSSLLKVPTREHVSVLNQCQILLTTPCCRMGEYCFLATSKVGI